MAASRSPKFVTTLWLLPAAPARKFFRAIVARLAAEYDAPVFQAHLTLGLGSPAMPERVLREPIRLRERGVHGAARFSKTLFVRFEPTPEWKELRKSLGITATTFDPHLSLLYKNLPMEKKTQLAASIRLPFSTVTFDTIQVVHCLSPTGTRADVESWKVLASQRLEAGFVA